MGNGTSPRDMPPDWPQLKRGTAPWGMRSVDMAAPGGLTPWIVVMSATGLDVFDKTLQTTNIWLEEINSKIGPDRQVAWRVLGAVLRSLRDRLPIGLAAHLGAQLPLLVRGLYYDQWHPRQRPLKLRSAKQFLDQVAAGLDDIRPVDTAEATRAVLQVLNHYLDPGQVSNVRASLSKPVRRLWPNGELQSEAQEANRPLERTAS
jgi:uncharacterized protein (DUF2267 family)